MVYPWYLYIVFAYPNSKFYIKNYLSISFNSFVLLFYITTTSLITSLTLYNSLLYIYFVLSLMLQIYN